MNLNGKPEMNIETSTKTVAIISLFILPMLTLVMWKTSGGNAKNEKRTKNLLHIVEINSKDSESFFRRGLANRELRRYKEAINDFTQAIYMNPSNSSAYQYRALTYVIVGAEEKARNDFTIMNSLMEND